jgi:hypothetical protein
VTLYQFNQLRYNAQLFAVYAEGIFLASRAQAEHHAVNLYAMPGRFFVEVAYETAATELLDVRSFTSLPPLEAYATSVKLPDWVPGVE